MHKDAEYMRMALTEARKAFAKGEVPIGAVVILEGEIIASGHNLRETNRDATAHAEMIAIREACARLDRWRLSDATLYVTIEPCPMCAGALVMSRVKRVVYGSADYKAGAAESLFNIVNNDKLNHRLEVTAGVLEDECKDIMKEFFQMRRLKAKELKKAAKKNEDANQKASPTNP